MYPTRVLEQILYVFLMILIHSHQIFRHQPILVMLPICMVPSINSPTKMLPLMMMFLVPFAKLGQQQQPSWFQPRRAVPKIGHSNTMDTYVQVTMENNQQSIYVLTVILRTLREWDWSTVMGYWSSQSKQLHTVPVPFMCCLYHVDVCIVNIACNSKLYHVMQ